MENESWLQTFIENERMAEAVKSFLLSQAMVKYDKQDSDELLGQKVRGVEEAKDIIIRGFKELQYKKRVEEPKRLSNPAR